MYGYRESAKTDTSSFILIAAAFGLLGVMTIVVASRVLFVGLDDPIVPLLEIVFFGLLILQPVLAVLLVVWFRNMANRRPKERAAALHEKDTRLLASQKEDEKAFVSLTTHQLRTPLTSMGWYIEMLLDEYLGKLTDEQRTYLERMHADNRRVIELVGVLDDVSRLEHGLLVSKPRSVDVIALTEGLIRKLRPHMIAKKLSLSAEHARTQLFVYIDPGLFGIALRNVLVNAIKYTPEGGRITVSIDTHRRGAEIAGEIITKDSLLVRVEDTGYGIPAEDRGHIFTKMFRAGNVQEENSDGFGMGLYVVRAVVEQMGGKIWFSSEEGEGTTFYIAVPSLQDAGPRA